MATQTGERGWLRPLGLLAIAMTVSTGQPLVLIVTAFGILTLIASGGRLGALALAAIGFALVYSGQPGEGLWYLERGWAILVAGCFAAITLANPGSSFFLRALLAVAGGSAAAGILVVALDGWSAVDWIVASRLEAGATSTLQLVRLTLGPDVEASIVDTVLQSARIQTVVFPALVGLTTLASLGVAWWLHVRLTSGFGGGLGPLRDFRFPDPMVWLLIAGVILVLLAEWSVGWGRLGTNLVTFMAALYVVRGAGVLLFLSGGVSFGLGILIAIGIFLAGPVLLGGAGVVGLGDSWLDIRERARRNEDTSTT